MTGNVYSVGQINAYIKAMFAQDFVLNRICIRGEVSNCKYHSSGHIYFTLKDSSGVLQAVMFAGSRRKGLKFPMRVGDSVVCTGSIRVYERDGKYQLYAEEILPAGEGLLYRRFEELKKELEEMGMFAAEYKKPIPVYASRIGVVTAPTGAAVRDIQNVSARRNPCVQLILYPAKVQGEGAAQSIVQGIRELEALGVDVMIVGRGGGSMEDLWAFNEEIVARAIFDCSVPVISAVGHETDFTIADFVADLRAPTPSAAAEIAVADLRGILERLDGAGIALGRQMSRRLESERNRLRQYGLRIQMQSPKTKLADQRQRAADLEDALCSRMERLLQDDRHRLQLLAAALDAHSPLKKLQGGYAYVTDLEGTRAASATQLREGEQIRAVLADGSFTAQISEVTVFEENER